VLNLVDKMEGNMYAIVKIGSKQFKVKEGSEIICDRVNSEPGAELTIDHVLMVSDAEKIVLGDELAKYKVLAQVIEHLKGDKILVFKYKPKKGYRRLHGHRQALSKLKITAIKKAGEKGKKSSKAKEGMAVSGGEK